MVLLSLAMAGAHWSQQDREALMGSDAPRRHSRTKNLLHKAQGSCLELTVKFVMADDVASEDWSTT